MCYVYKYFCHLVIMNMSFWNLVRDLCWQHCWLCVCGFVFELFRLIFCDLLGMSYQKPLFPLRYFMLLSVAFLEQPLNCFRMQALWNTTAYAWKSPGETVIIACTINSWIPLIDPDGDIQLWSKLYNILHEKCLTCINCFWCIWTW